MRSIDDVLTDPSISEWLKSALRSALDCDAVAAANDADVLRALLMRRATHEPLQYDNPLPLSAGT